LCATEGDYVPRKITEAAAIEALISRGARPIEPFPGTQIPWKCLCLTCNEVSAPRYNDVVNKGTGVCNKTCRSRTIAAKLTRDGAHAAAVMLTWGWDPLEGYPGAGKPWLARCVHCGAIKPKKLSHVQNGRGGCTSCAGRDVTDESARKLMAEADLEPLVGYPGSLQPWLCRCMRCSHIGTPTYAKVRARGHQCWSCRSEKIADALRLDATVAIASMLEKGLEPLVPYPGSTDLPWKARCLTCETVLTPGPTLHNIRGTQGGCPTCAARGINPARPGYLYLVVHEGHRALKWGIANVEQRITQHVSQGWQLVARWNFEQTGDAWALERQIKTWVRGQGIPRALTTDQMKYGGHTETAFLADIDVHQVRQYIESLTARRPESPPLP
jgi:predicted GIY-YIG superfamily endonuclease